MTKKHRLDENQHYVAGKRGIRFQRPDGVMVAIEPGKPVPEAVDFPNVRLLVNCDRLEVVDNSNDESNTDSSADSSADSNNDSISKFKSKKSKDFNKKKKK